MGAFIIITGVAIFGTLAGYLANKFLASPKTTSTEDQPADDTEERIEQLRSLLAQQQAAFEELVARIRTSA
jgi:hypothetical protein